MQAREQSRFVALVGLGLAVLVLPAGCDERSEKWKQAECIPDDPDKPPCPRGTLCLDDLHCHALCKESSSECESPVEACFLPDGVCKVYSAACDAANPSCMEGFYCAASGACAKKLGLGAGCNDADECWSAVCQDGYCCTSCQESCSGCAEELTGQPSGTCAHVLAGLDPHEACTGALACRGDGSCYEPNGTVCTDADKCASGNCVDGYCCNDTCEGTCMACAATYTGEADGTCAPMPMFSDPEGECLSAGGYGCTGTNPGACKTVTTVVAPDAQANDSFGFAVAISGDYAIVGAYKEDGDSDDTPDAGAAYVFHRAGANAWDTGTKLVAPDAQGGEGFGWSVAISGDHAIVGADLADVADGDGGTLSHAGAAYVFHRTGANAWDAGAKLVAPDTQASDLFGQSVAMSGDYAIVGANLTDGSGGTPRGAGTAYVFHRTDVNTWDTGTRLVAPDGHAQAGAAFGKAVAISGEYAIVGAHGEDVGTDAPISNAGAAYVFHRTGVETWDSGTRLVAPVPQADACFGGSVAISGEHAIVGAYREDAGDGDGTRTDAGAAYIYHRTEADTWDFGVSLDAGGARTKDHFGFSVAISGEYAIAAAPGHDGDSGGVLLNTGAGYVFTRTGQDTWNAGAKLVAPMLQAYSGLGTSIAASGERSIVGAPYMAGQDGDSGGTINGAGAAYIY